MPRASHDSRRSSPGVWPCSASSHCAASAAISDSGPQRFLDSGNRYIATGEYAEAAVQYRNARAVDPARPACASSSAKHSCRVETSAMRWRSMSAQRTCSRTIWLCSSTPATCFSSQADSMTQKTAQKRYWQDAGDINAQILVANALAGLKDFDAAVNQIEEAIKIARDRSGTYSNLGALELSAGGATPRNRHSRKRSTPTDFRPGHVALGIFYLLTDRWRPRSSVGTCAGSRAAQRPDEPGARRFLPGDESPRPRRTTSQDCLAGDGNVRFGVRAGGVLAAMAATPLEGPSWSRSRATLARLPRERSIGGPRLQGRRPRRRYAGWPAFWRRIRRTCRRSPGVGLLLSDGRADEALASVNAAAERHPDSAPALFALGRVQVARRQPAAAIAAYREVLRLNPRATEAKVALGQLELMQGRPDVSVALAGEALANEPGNADAHLLYVRGLLTKGELDRAEVDLKQLMARFPDSAAVHTQMGMLFGRKGRLPEARDGIRAGPANPAGRQARHWQARRPRPRRKEPRRRAGTHRCPDCRQSHSRSSDPGGPTYAAGGDLVNPSGFAQGD